jgi:hypothetical protein
MKRAFLILGIVFLVFSTNAQLVFRTTGNQYINGRLSIYPTGSWPDNGYNGNLTITKPTNATAQYINLVRQSSYPWSIGMIYNTSTFAIGPGKANESDFNNPYFTILPSGNIGVGLNEPSHKLHINGSLFVQNANINASKDIVIGTGNKQFLLHSESDTPGNPPVLHFAPKLTAGGWDFTRSITINNSGKMFIRSGVLGLGTSTPIANFHNNSGSNNPYAAILATSSEEGNNLVVSSLNTQSANGSVFKISHEYFNNPANRNNGYISFLRGQSFDDGFLEFGTRGLARMIIDSNGKVGIGTSNIPSDYKLAVEGKIIAEEVMIKHRSGWPDFVFHNDYDLMPIAEVESFVLKNSHLPGIPDAATVRDEGLSIGEMQKLLLQKIEELTLYIIKQDKDIKQLKTELSVLKQTD